MYVVVSDLNERLESLKFCNISFCNINLQIIDEKSLIKKYQQEIQCLKEELEQLKKGIVTVQPKDTGDDDIELLKQKVGNAICKPHPSVLFGHFLLKKC